MFSCEKDAPIKKGWEEYVAAICNFYGPDEVKEYGGCGVEHDRNCKEIVNRQIEISICSTCVCV